MELGQRIKEARLAAGMSQRQLCEGTITRNMLSRIENGTVRPSMTTMRFLAERLGKPVSYFLDETTVTSPNLQLMLLARQCYRQGDYSGALEKLEEYKTPDETFDDEKLLLQVKCYLALASNAILHERMPYAAELLQKAELAGKMSAYVGSALSAYVIPLATENAGWNVTLLLWLAMAGLGTALCLVCIPAWKKMK